MLKILRNITEFEESEVYADRWHALEQKLKNFSLSEKEDFISSIKMSQKILVTV